MSRALLAGGALAALLLAAAPRPARAEPIFLAKQYARCTTCHHSPTGGGLLTAYGRSLTRQEISTSGPGLPATGEGKPGRFREEAFLHGLLGDTGPLDLGLDFRPTRLRFESGGRSFRRDLWMSADLRAAYHRDGLTLYGEVGRLPSDPPEVVSREHWLGYTAENGLGFRAGRFLPAFGLRLADHTAFNRRDLGFDQDGQIYGFEVSHAGEKRLWQFAVGPGRAESLLAGDRSASLTATARLQWDLERRNVLVLSGLHRAATDRAPADWVGSIAHGWAPSPHVVFWTELDERAAKGWGGTPAYTIVHETSLEIARGVWLKLSPQIRTELGNVSGGTTRLALGLQLFPRPHWNLNLWMMRDRDRVGGTTFKTYVLQLHLYL